MFGFSGAYRVVGHQTLTVSNSAVSPTIPATTAAMIVRINDTTLRWDAVGGTPTASDGKTEDPGTELLFDASEELANFSAIRKSGTDSEIDFVFLTKLP